MARLRAVGLIIGLILVLSVFSPSLLGFTFADTESGKTVYLIRSHIPELKHLFEVRHNFDVGFTAFLSEKQANGLQNSGITVEEVPLYYLTKPPGACDPWPECKNGGGSGEGDSGRIGTPSDQTPWGIERVYNDGSIISTNGGGGIDIAVLDSGADKNHPDLSGRIADCMDFTKGPGPKKGCEDNLGHGTHVAGTIAADSGSDSLGIFGVAPEANLLIYKVCGGSGCWTDDIAAAIDYAGSRGAEIVSMSLGGDTESLLIKNAIARNPGILFVAAAGNDGPILGTIDYPGANPNVIAVGATDVNDRVADFSSRGIDVGQYNTVIDEREIEVAGPGVDVESTCAGSYDGASFDKDGIVNGYCIISGTSMATPHISGLAAKLWQGDAASTRAYLQNRAIDITAGISAGEGYDPASGYGLPTVG